MPFASVINLVMNPTLCTEFFSTYVINFFTIK